MIKSLENILSLVCVYLAVMHWKLLSVLFLRKLPINQGIFLEKKEENGSGKKTLFGLSCTKVAAQCIINEPVRR